jgi:hypothetical protein
MCEIWESPIAIHRHETRLDSRYSCAFPDESEEVFNASRDSINSEKGDTLQSFATQRSQRNKGEA